VRLVAGESSGTVTETSIILTLDRSTTPVRYVASFGVRSGIGDVVGTSSGEAVDIDGVWHLRGRAVLDQPGEGGRVGGFRADVGEPSGGTAAVRWGFDGLLR
jgi:hypothetical protein